MFRSTTTLRLKTGFAFNHLRVAAQSAREAYRIETAGGASFGEWFDGMMRQVPVSVVMAGAALEANANEILQDIIDGSSKITISPPRKKLLAGLKEEHIGNATSRCRRLALLLDKDPDTGTEPWHNMSLLVRFRNEFMHFRPTMDDESVHSAGFVAELRRKIPVVESYEEQFLFPHGFMTYGCAKWAVETVLTFSSDFADLLGVNDRFAVGSADFELP